MPKLVFHPDVASEIKASHAWYQTQAAGLGDDFISELESAYQAITELPETWPKFQRGFRRYLLSKFPFSVIYKDTDDYVFVVAELCITVEGLVIGPVAHNQQLHAMQKPRA